MHKPLMALLKTSDDEFLAPRREDIRKFTFVVGPRAQARTTPTSYDKAVLRKLSTMTAQPILLNRG